MTTVSATFTRPIKSTIVRSKKSSGISTTKRLLMRLRLELASLLAPRATARYAADLFTTPLPGSRERATQSPLFGAQRDQIEVDGEQIALYHWGNTATQPIVLFSHGWSSFGLRVSSWLDALREAGFAVVAFDQVAHGLSSGRHATLPDFGRITTAVARHLGKVDTLIGHSLGGTASALALAEGIGVRRAVLIAPAADARAATERFANMLGLSERVRAPMREYIIRAAGVPFEQLAVQNSVPHLSTPALIVHDLEDQEVPWEEGERYARYWPQARLLSTQGLGHHRIVSDPSVIEASLRFIRGETVGVRVVSSPNLPYGFG